MCEVGAWRSFLELEDNLTLEELMELYDMAGERQFRTMRMMAQAMGAEVDDPYAEEDPRDKKVLATSSDFAQLPFGLGYESKG